MKMRTTNKFFKTLCASMAVVMASGCLTLTANAAEATDCFKNENRSEESLLATSEVLTEISNIVTLLSEDAGYSSFTIGEPVSAYNVDSQDTFFLYPVYCDGFLAFVAHADDESSVCVTNNTNTYKAIASLDNECVCYVDNGTYYASYEDYTIEIYKENYEITCEGINFDDLSFDEKEEIITQDAEESQLGTLLTAEQTMTYDWNDWYYWWGYDNGQNNPQGETITKKCGITNFLRQGKYGICWACTVGTIVNYKLGQNLQGTDVADMMGIRYDVGATASQLKMALARYGLSYRVMSSKLSFPQVQSNIDADKPFAICLKTENAGHAITGYGYSYNTANTSANASTNLVYAWDSNGFQISFAQNASTVDTSGYKFQWFSTVY